MNPAEEAELVQLSTEYFRPNSDYDNLDRLLKAWAAWSLKAEWQLYGSLGYPTPSGDMVKKHYKDKEMFDEPVVADFDEELLGWLDSIIQDELTPSGKSLIKYEVFHKRDRKRIDAWCKKWCQLPKDYHEQNAAARKYLLYRIGIRSDGKGNH
jgi:hypothetical protein